MYIWNIEGLKKQIVEGELSQSHRFFYLLLFVALTTALMEMSSYVPTENPGFSDYFGSLAYVFIVSVFTLGAYRVNGGSKGSEFTDKYLSIGFVVGFRFFVVFLLFLAAVIIYTYNVPEDEVLFESEWVYVMFYLAWEVLIYYRIYVHIKEIAHCKKA